MIDLAFKCGKPNQSTWDKPESHKFNLLVLESGILTMIRITKKNLCDWDNRWVYFTEELAHLYNYASLTLCPCKGQVTNENNLNLLQFISTPAPPTRRPSGGIDNGNNNQGSRTPPPVGPPPVQETGCVAGYPVDHCPKNAANGRCNTVSGRFWFFKVLLF